MSSERDAGVQALQKGDPTAAAPLLEAACTQDPNDYDAHLFLGAAYGQVGRQMDAIHTITRAVQLQPANAQARYNLAVAMEQAGYREQAVQALGQALTLQPDYPKAQDALRRLQAGASTPESAPPAVAAEPDNPSPTGFGLAAASGPDLNSAPAYGPPPAPGYGPALFGAPPPQASERAADSPQTGTNPYAASVPGPYGTPEPLPTVSPAASPYGSLQNSGPYGAPVAQGLYGQTYPHQQPSARARDYVDSFDLGQAARDWIRILIKPAVFFREMTGSTGMLAPLALALLYFVPVIVAFVLKGAQTSLAFRQVPNLGPMLASGGVVITLVFVVPVIVIGMFLAAWVIHLMGLLFGNRSSYSASFRALVFAYAPIPWLQVINALIPVTDPNQFNPLSGLITLIGFVWWLILIAMAISSEQEISIGAAIGVILLSFIAWIVLAFGIGFALFLVLLMIGIAVGASSHGMIPL